MLYFQSNMGTIFTAQNAHFLKVNTHKQIYFFIKEFFYKNYQVSKIKILYSMHKKNRGGGLFFIKHILKLYLLQKNFYKNNFPPDFFCALNL